MAELIIFTKKNNSKPLLEWLASLKDKTIQGRIYDRIQLIETHNYFGDCKHIDNGIWELRFHFGKGYRVYIGKIKTTTVLLLCGGDKDTQHKDIQKAKEYWDEFKEERLW